MIIFSVSSRLITVCALLGAFVGVAYVVGFVIALAVSQ
jgi:hypothetical protein